MAGDGGGPVSEQQRRSAPRRGTDTAGCSGSPRPTGRRFAAAWALGVLAAVSVVLLMAASAWLISAAALQPPLIVLSLAIVAVRAFALGRAVFRYLERLVAHDVAFRLLARLRVRFYRHLEPLAPAGLPAFRRGDLLARLVATSTRCRTCRCGCCSRSRSPRRRRPCPSGWSPRCSRRPRSCC